VFFDTLCVSFSFVFFKFLVFETAIYANKDVYIDPAAHTMRAVSTANESMPKIIINDTIKFIC